MSSLVVVRLLNAADLTLPVAEYGVGDWDAEGRGSHRAVIEVDRPAGAVRVTIPWRRHDEHPEQKGIVVETADGKRVNNVVPLMLTQACGKLVFEPQAGPGTYYLYYLPFTQPQNWWDKPGPHLGWKDISSPEWRTQCHLDNAAMVAALPEASSVRLEARTEFDRFDPMEVAATPEETAQLAQDCDPVRPYRIFVEDRSRPIRMFRFLPVSWVTRTGEEKLAATVRPGEIYAFQLGVWAPGEALSGLNVSCSDPALAFSCINTGGIDAFGDPIAPEVAVPAGGILPLWCLVRIPAEAPEPEYRGTLSVACREGQPTEIPYVLKVTGEVLADGGVGSLDSLSRLAWLDSAIAQDDEVIPPFTPLEVDGNSIRCVGRTVEFGADGLPTSVGNGDSELLAGPVALRVLGGDGQELVREWHSSLVSQAPGKVEFVCRGDGSGVSLVLHGQMEMDGTILYRVELNALRDLSLYDVRLEIPYVAGMAEYMMGWGARGGYRHVPWNWHWDISRADNYLWLGVPRLGMQLCLPGARRDRFDPMTLNPTGLPEGWYNGGKGGGTVEEHGSELLVNVYSGERRLAAGDTLNFDFRLLVTPMKPYPLAEHWNWRHAPGYGAAPTLYQLCHARQTNWWINYPYLDLPGLRRKIQRYRNFREEKNPGRLVFPLSEELDLRHGSIDAEVRVELDPTEGDLNDASYHQEFFHIDFPDGDMLSCFWNGGLQGLATYIRFGAPPSSDFRIYMQHRLDYWRKGETHRIGLSWDGENISYYLDGNYAGSAPYPAAWRDRDPAGGKLIFEGHAFSIRSLRFRDRPLDSRAAAELTADAATKTLIFPGTGEVGAAGRLEGVTECRDGFLVFDADSRPNPVKLELYFAAREISNRAGELWAFRALKDEILAGSGFNYSDRGAETTGEGEGYYWLREHFERGYAPAWMERNATGEFDAAVALNGPTRYHNFYLESVRWLMENAGVQAIYLDGFGAERTVAKRLAKVMFRSDPDSHLNWHGGNNYDYMNKHASVLNNYMEILPYIDDMWIGEFFDFNRSPDYWLIEISGIPFGTPVDLLNHVDGGNPWRGMLYAALARQHPASKGLWPYFDRYGIQHAGMIGYWEKNCPVKTDNPEVLATVYPQPDKALIAVAHWSTDLFVAKRAVAVRGSSPPPVIDGELSDPVWLDAAKLTGFSAIRSPDPGKPVGQQSEVCVSWDDEKLYFAFRLFAPGQEMRADVKERDGAVWDDDAFEIFIQPDRNSDKYFQFVGNAAGVFHDNRQLDAGWQGAWEYRAMRTADGWQGEASIPWRSLDRDVPGAPAEIGINFGRDQQTPVQQYSSWSYCKNTFQDIGSFGTMTLADCGESTREAIPAYTGSEDMVRFRLDIDWAALGLDPGRVRFHIPDIPGFQDGRPVPEDGVFSCRKNRGLLIEVEAE